MASPTLSAKAQAILADLMPEMSEDTSVQIVIDALARELQRIEDAGYDIVQRMFAHNADDKYRTLGMWESMLGLPVEPPGIDLATRQNAVQALVQSRNSSSGLEWINLITIVLGSSGWTHQEGPSAYTVTLRVPYVAGGIVAGQLTRVAQRFTPAHLNLAATYDEGFLIGVSLMGDAL